jgi:hypothetical protein
LINPSTRSAQNLTTATGLTIFSGQNQPYYIETFVQNNQLQSHFILPNNPALSQKLEIPIFTDLCSESRDPVFLYCAIPDSSVSNYPTAWYQGRENYRFKIVAINPLNGQVGNLYLPNSNISFNQLSSLKVNSRNTTLYFVKNNKLWQYDLLP